MYRIVFQLSGGLTSWLSIGLNQLRCSTLGPVSTGMGDASADAYSKPSGYVTGYTGYPKQLSLDILPGNAQWVPMDVVLIC